MKTNFSKNILTAFFFLAAIFTFSSCNNDVLRGKGDEVSRTRTVGSFDEISMGGEFEVYLTQGPSADLILEGQENVLADLRTTTRNNKLEIDFRSHRVKIDKPVRVYITTPDLKAISVSGSNKIQGLTDWKVNNLDLSASGSTNINLTVREAKSVETHVSGSGEIVLKGDSENQLLDISGSGTLRAFGLITKVTEAKISGSGSAEVTANEKLTATISGSGKIRYKGNPEVNSTVSGSGSVRKAD